MLLIEHGYLVAVASEMSKQVEHQICIQFCIKFEHSSVETIQMIQEAAATGEWWLAASSRQHTCSCITSCGFLVKHQITQVTQPPYNPDLAFWDFWLFPKLKSPLKGKRFQPLMRVRKIRWGSWRWLGELCEVPRCPLWRGLGRHCSMCLLQ